ncbi:MAG TPA: S-layer homology domain-containing protein [Firmicutes bacterium]|nr:S-layer homology domain-containing protein [Bacillota bacterium]
MKKTLVALFVALCMVLTMAPAMAFAADEPQIDSVVYYADQDAADEAGVDVGNIVVTLKNPIGDTDTKIGFEIEVNSDRYYYQATEGEAADINKKSFSFKMTETEKNWNDVSGDTLAAGTYTIKMFEYTAWKEAGMGEVIDTATFTVPGESIDLANGFFDVANPDADTVKDTPFEDYPTWVTADQTFYFQVEEAIAGNDDKNGYLFEITADGKTYSAVGNVLLYNKVPATLYGSFLSDGVDFIDKVKTTSKNNDYELAPGTYTVSVLKFVGNGYNNGIASDIFDYPVDAKEVATFEITVASADYSDWNGLVAYINNLDEMDYTEEGWEKFCDNVEPYISSEGAHYVKPDQPKTYQDTIENAEKHLESWINWLSSHKTADYSYLNAMIAVAEGLDKSDYTADSWETVETALKEAKDVPLRQGTGEQDEITNAAEKLVLAMSRLVGVEKANYAAVDAAIAKAETLTEADYTADSWAAVEAAIDAVVRDLPVSDQAKVDAMAKAINDAIDALVVEKANYAAVDAAIAKAETLTEADYTADSWAAVEAAIDAVVRDLPVSDQAKVDAMAKAINDAIDALVAAEPEDPTDPEDPTKIVFDDVEQGRWSAQYIYDLVEKGICDGIGDNKFNPEGNIERCAFAKILAEASGDDLTRYEGTSNFADCRGSWAETYINWAYANGIVTGRTDTTFDPYGEISRQEMAAMIYRYAEYKGIELPETNELITFDDEEQIADYAAEAVDAMQKAGIINGMDNNEFQPQGTATREQAAKMISVLLSL